MDNLIPLTPCADLLPLTIGSVSLVELDLGQLTLIQPFSGHFADVSDRVQASIGLTLPATNRSVSAGEARIVWFGRESYLYVNARPPDLDHCAAVTDQSDAWACVEISGYETETVLARLVPIDLRPSEFEENSVARTLVGHMTATVMRLGENRILIMVFRSMAETLVHELKEAMEAVAARR